MDFSFWYNELYWHLWVHFDITLEILSGKNTKKSKHIKYLGFVKLGVQWAKQDIMQQKYKFKLFACFNNLK